MSTKLFRMFALLLSFCVLHVCETIAQFDDSTNIESLRGLKGIVVIVKEVSPEAERDGITKDKLQTGVELKLRQAGIRVIPLEELKKTKESNVGWLDLTVSALKYDSGGFYACNFHLKLMQLVLLQRDPSRTTFATTWSTGSVGVFGIMKLRGIRQEVADKVDEFTNSYLRVNPK